MGGEHPVTKEPMHIRRKTRIKDRERVGHEKVQGIDELRNRCMFKAILATKTVNVLAMKTFKEFVNWGAHVFSAELQWVTVGGLAKPSESIRLIVALTACEKHATSKLESEQLESASVRSMHVFDLQLGHMVISVRAHGYFCAGTWLFLCEV